MIEFQNVSMAYKDRPVLNHVDLTIQDSEFFVLIGSSGCGKTTLLKSINKLLNVQKGKLLINGTPVDRIKTNQLPNLVGYVVQAGGLFPHLTVEENIALVMRIAGYPSERISERVTEMLRMVDLDPDTYRNQYPSQLSGGQQQRVGVARAFAVDPPIVLMDEPFSALDPMTRAELQDEIHTLQKKTKKTVVFVTHDMDEAIKIADRICIMRNGHILQFDTPEQILKHPADDFIASFVGTERIWDSPEFIRVSDFMIKETITCHGDLNRNLCIKRMRDHHIDSLLVVDEQHHLRGVVTRRALFRAESPLARAEEIMEPVRYTARDDDNIVNILRMVQEAEVNAVPVLDASEKLVGLLTNSSLVATLSRQFLTEEKGVADG